MTDRSVVSEGIAECEVDSHLLGLVGSHIIGTARLGGACHGSTFSTDIVGTRGLHESRLPSDAVHA